jgi:hypothetical protein
MVEQHGDRAVAVAAKRASDFVDFGDLVAGALWANITQAIREMTTQRQNGEDSN